MANNVKETLEGLQTIDGAVASAVVDGNSGMVLGKAGSGVDLDMAAAGNTEVIRAKLKTMASLGLNDEIEDILITLGKHYHILRPLKAIPGLFMYIVLDKSRANLAMARIKVQLAEGALKI